MEPPNFSHAHRDSCLTLAIGYGFCPFSRQKGHVNCISFTELPLLLLSSEIVSYTIPERDQKIAIHGDEQTHPDIRRGRFIVPTADLSALGAGSHVRI